MLISLFICGLLAVVATGVATADSHEIDITTTYGDDENTTTLSENSTKRTGKAGTLTVTATVQESSDTTLDAASIRINGKEVHRAPMSGTSDSTNHSQSYREGWYNVEVLITASDGNVRSRTYTLYVDVIPPRLQMTQGDQFIEPSGTPKTISGTRHWFNGSFVDTSNVTQFEISVVHNKTRLRTPVAKGSDGGFSSRVDLRVGENTVRYSTTDEYGNKRRGSNTFILEDEGDPTLSVGPVPDSTYEKTVTVNGTASDDTYIREINITFSDPDGGTDQFAAVSNPDYVNNTHPERHRSESFSEQIAVTQNTTDITVTAVDGEGNSVSEDISVTKLTRENQPPNITLSNRSVLNLANDELVLHGTVTDDREISKYDLDVIALPSGETIGFDIAAPEQKAWKINDSYTVRSRARISITVTDNDSVKTTRTFIADPENKSFVDEDTGQQFPIAGLPNQFTPEATPTPTPTPAPSSTPTPTPEPTPEPDIRVTNVSINETTPAVNDTVMLNVTAENGGSSDGTLSVTVVLNGSTLSTTQMSVAAGSTRTENITQTLPEAGELLVNNQRVTTVGDENSGLFSFLPDFLPDLGGLPNPLALWPSGLPGTVLGGLLGLITFVYAVLKALAIYLGY
jgi:hypothetical protein